MNVDDLKKLTDVKDDTALAKKLGVTRQSVSNWRINGVPAKVELKARDMLSTGSTSINGDNHHIDIHHASVAEDREEYSPAMNMIIDIIKEWPEPRRRKLAAKVVMMNGEEKPEEG